MPRPSNEYGGSQQLVESQEIETKGFMKKTFFLLIIPLLDVAGYQLSVPATPTP